MIRIFMTGILLLFAVTGCSKRPPKTVAVNGTVLVNGKPASGTVVGFWPADKVSSDEMKYRSGSVVADDAGRFQFSPPGLVPGKYKVTFSRVLDRQGKPAPMAKPDEVGGRETVPAALRDPGQTTQVVDVGADAAPVTLNFDAER